MKTRVILNTRKLRIYTHRLTNFMFIKNKEGGFLQLGVVTVAWSNSIDKDSKRS